MGVSSDLQRVIVARLKAAAPMLAGRVYDRKPPESAAMPYARVGPAYGVDDSAECIDAEEITLQIDVFASSYPDSRVINDATGEVKRALKGWADTAALTMHPLRVSLWRVEEDPDPAVLHGVVQVEAMVEDQPGNP